MWSSSSGAESKILLVLAAMFATLKFQYIHLRSSWFTCRLEDIKKIRSFRTHLHHRIKPSQIFSRWVISTHTPENEFSKCSWPRNAPSAPSVSLNHHQPFHSSPRIESILIVRKLWSQVALHHLMVPSASWLPHWWCPLHFLFCFSVIWNEETTKQIDSVILYTTPYDSGNSIPSGIWSIHG